MTDNWRDALPDEIKELETLQDIPDVETLAKSYDDAQKYVGRSIRIPSEDAGDEAITEFRTKLTQVPGVVILPGEDDKEGWNAFYSKLGRPSDGYGTDNEDFEKLAFEVGLTKDQATRIHDAANTASTEQDEARKLELAAKLEALQSEWGNAFDHKSRLATQAVQFLDREIKANGDLEEQLSAPGIGDNPLLIRALSKLGSLLGENKLGMTEVNNVFNVTPAEALERANEIMGNFQSPYHDAAHPQHNTTVDKVQRLMEVAHPDT